VELSYKDFVDFMTKKRVNGQMQEKGFVDPLLASSVAAINRVKDGYSLTIQKFFTYLAGK